MKINYSLIEGSVRRLYEAKRKKDQIDKWYEEVRKKEQVAISNFMFTNVPKGEEHFDITLSEGVEYYTNHKHLGVTRVRRKKIIWDMNKLKEKLPKEKYKAVTTRRYEIEDMEGLVKYLKKCGVNPKRFKSFLNVTESVDEKELNNMSELGEITESDIRGCYTVELSDPYIRITESKRDDTEV